jgi:cytochrome c
MKKIIFIYFASSLIFVSCKKEETKETATKIPQNSVDLGKELFEGKGNCVACHLVDQKVIGPSIQEIAKIYKDQKGNIIDFLKNDAKPIVDPSQYEVMKTNFTITKAMSDEELSAIETYIYSHSK